MDVAEGWLQISGNVFFIPHDVFRYACICTCCGPPAGSGQRAVWKLWWRHREWLYDTTGHRGVHRRAVWKLLEGQPLLPWRGRPGPPRPLCCEFNTAHIHISVHTHTDIWRSILITSDGKSVLLSDVQKSSFAVSHRYKCRSTLPALFITLSLFCSAKPPQDDLGQEKVCSPDSGTLLSVPRWGAFPAVLWLVCLWCLWVSDSTNLHWIPQNVLPLKKSYLLCPLPVLYTKKLFLAPCTDFRGIFPYFQHFGF